MRLRHSADLEHAKGRIIMTPDPETLTLEQAQAVVATTEQPAAASRTGRCRRTGR